MSRTVPANELNFDQEVLGSELPVLVDVSTAWCAPCKAAIPVLAELASQYGGKLKVVTVDGDESPALAARLGVRGYPTFIGFVAGNAVERQAGFAGRRSLESMVSSLIRRDG